MEATKSSIGEAPAGTPGAPALTGWLRVHAGRLAAGDSFFLIGAAVMPLLALAVSSNQLFFALTLLNTALFGLATVKNRRNPLAGKLALASGLAAIAGIPMDGGLWLAPGFTRVRAVELCLGGWVALQALRSRHPAMSLCGALAAALAPAIAAGEFHAHWSLCAGLSFFVLHSLRWDEGISKGVVGLRIGTAVSWMTHAFVWTRVDVGAAVWVVSSAAVLILLIYTLLGVVTGQWGARVVPAGAVLSFLAAPANIFSSTSSQHGFRRPSSRPWSGGPWAHMPSA